MSREEPYYRPDLARVHHLCFGFHADDCAHGVLAQLEPVLERDGLVVELGCGSGLFMELGGAFGSEEPIAGLTTVVGRRVDPT